MFQVLASQFYRVFGDVPRTFQGSSKPVVVPLIHSYLAFVSIMENQLLVRSESGTRKCLNKKAKAKKNLNAQGNRRGQRTGRGKAK